MPVYGLFNRKNQREHASSVRAGSWPSLVDRCPIETEGEQQLYNVAPLSGRQELVKNQAGVCQESSQLRVVATATAHRSLA